MAKGDLMKLARQPGGPLHKKAPAKKKRSKATKLQPAVRYLRYELTNSGTPGTETSHYIDLARDLSAINRRLYRQGRTYHVKRVSIVSSNTLGAPGGDAGRISISTAPTSWVMIGAWKRAFDRWNLMNKTAMADAGNTDVSGAYADFKVYLSADSRSATLLLPKDNGGNNLTLGEWNYAEIQSPDGTTGADAFTLHLLGDHVGSAGAWNSVGLAKSYGDARTTVDNDQPNVPTTLADDPIANMFDHGTVTDEVLASLGAENDNAPYSVTLYPGGDNHPKPIVVQQTTLGADGRSSVGGFSVMCGVLEFEASSPVANDVYSVLVELAPGKYRGIAADVI